MCLIPIIAVAVALPYIDSKVLGLLAIPALQHAGAMSIFGLGKIVGSQLSDHGHHGHLAHHVYAEPEPWIVHAEPEPEHWGHHGHHGHHGHIKLHKHIHIPKVSEIPILSNILPIPDASTINYYTPQSLLG